MRKRTGTFIINKILEIGRRGGVLFLKIYLVRFLGRDGEFGIFLGWEVWKSWKSLITLGRIYTYLTSASMFCSLGVSCTEGREVKWMALGAMYPIRPLVGWEVESWFHFGKWRGKQLEDKMEACFSLDFITILILRYFSCNFKLFICCCKILIWCYCYIISLLFHVM